MSKLVTLDGFHAIKHAFRFGATIVRVVALEDSNWHEIASELAPDVIEQISARIETVSIREFEQISISRHPTGIAATAERPHFALDPQRTGDRTSPALLLENPRNLGNVGAVIRLAAAGGASGVLTTGELDPWHAAVIRGAAGLHYALPVLQATMEQIDGPILAFDAKGKDLQSMSIPSDAVLAFGTERYGVSPELKQRAHSLVSLPMEAGVSSLNLATSAAIALYDWRLSQSI